MREAWLTELRRAAAWFAFAGLVGWVTAAPALIVTIAALAYAAWHLHHLARLLRWVENDQTLRMRSLVEDLLRLAHLEVGPEQAGEDLVHVARMVETIRADCGTLRGGANAMAVDADCGFGLLGELYSAFSNLVVNAVRYTPPGGTGPGPAIVEHVLARYDAKLLVESTVGEGSVFSCVFPAARACRPGEHETLAVNEA